MSAFCAHHFLLYSFTASDDLEGTTAGCVVSPHSIMMHHGFRSKVFRYVKSNINYFKQHHTPLCWLPAKVMYPADSTKHFSWLTCSTPIFNDEERSNMIISYFQRLAVFVQMKMFKCWLCMIYIFVCSMMFLDISFITPKLFQ